MYILTAEDAQVIFGTDSFKKAREKIERLTQTNFRDIACKVKEHFESTFHFEFKFRLFELHYERDVLNFSPQQMGVYDLTIPDSRMLLYFHLYTSVPREESTLIFQLKNTDLKVGHPWILEMYDLSIKELKTKTKFLYKLKIGIKTPIVETDFLPNYDECNHEFRLLNNETWTWQLLWQCKHCGFLTYCECFKEALSKVPPPPKGETIKVYGREIPLKYPGMVFYPNACEVCRGVPSSHMYCAPMYARSQFEVRYGAYVKKRMIEMDTPGDVNGNDELSKKIVNEVREALGYKRIGQSWFHEVELYKIAKTIFHDLSVQHHYKPEWLDGLELDIFIEELKIGIEYNGIQHYKPLDHWGGQEAFKKTKERDARKAQLCKENGILLIVFKYDESIDEANIRQKLRKVLKVDKDRWERAKRYF